MSSAQTASNTSALKGIADRQMAGRVAPVGILLHREADPLPQNFGNTKSSSLTVLCKPTQRKALPGRAPSDSQFHACRTRPAMSGASGRWRKEPFGFRSSAAA